MERWSMGVTATGLPLERTTLGAIPRQVDFCSRTLGTRLISDRYGGTTAFQEAVRNVE